MGKKKGKKLKNCRTKEERKEEGDKIINQMKLQYGLLEKIPGIRILYDKIYNFIETGESETGKIPYPEDKRTIHYIFSNNRNVKPGINIKLLLNDRKNVKEIIK